MVCMFVVRMKITRLGDLGPRVICKASEYIGIGEKLASVCFIQIVHF